MSAPVTDPFLRWQVPPEQVHRRWDVGDAVGVLHAGWHGRLSLTVLGDPDDAARLLVRALTEGAPVRRVTLPVGTLARLPDPLPGGLRVGDGADWDWMWTQTPPPVQPGEEHVVRLRPDEEPDVAALLDVASPRTSARPGDEGVRGWWGIREPAGRLVACAGHTERVTGVPHLAGIAVLPELRGRGLGGAVTAGITRAVLADGAEVCTLGMYADNDPARRVYDRLGYVTEHRFSSRVLTRARVSPGRPRAAGRG